MLEASELSDGTVQEGKQIPVVHRALKELLPADASELLDGPYIFQGFSEEHTPHGGWEYPVQFHKEAFQ